MPAAVAPFQPANAKQWACFLSHAKKDASMHARFLNNELERITGRKCFLDSDDLHDLRLLRDAVTRSSALVLPGVSAIPPPERGGGMWCAVLGDRVAHDDAVVGWVCGGVVEEEACGCGVVGGSPARSAMYSCCCSSRRHSASGGPSP